MANSLVIDGQIELLGGGTASTVPECAGAIFRLSPGWDLSSAAPRTDIVQSLLLDGQRPEGDSADNRLMAIPVTVMVPAGTAGADQVLAAAREFLLETVGKDQFNMVWTRDGGLPLVLECFKAGQSVVTYSLVDQESLISRIVLTIPAMPYGRSDQPVIVPLSAPVPGDPTPPAPVTLDTFATVTGQNQWSRVTTQHVVGTASAMWNPGAAPLSQPEGLTGVDAKFIRTGIGPFDLTGRTMFTVWAGFGAVRQFRVTELAADHRRDPAGQTRFRLLGGDRIHD